MGRKAKHEDHINHEAWAIPYGDLVTLLLAFFVVMYSISSVNEGKYRSVAASLSAAFRGVPKMANPIAIGHAGGSATRPGGDPAYAGYGTGDGEAGMEEAEIKQIANELSEALKDLIDEDVVVVKPSKLWLEVEIKTELLFASAQAEPTDEARVLLQRLVPVLKRFQHPVRVEGHTDHLPISTERFPSNWELSAARAASVVRLMIEQGIDAERLTVVGLGDNKPRDTNETVEGRNANRRVTLVIPSSKTLRRWLERDPSHIEDMSDEFESTNGE